MLGFLRELLEIFEKNNISTSWIGFAVFLVIVILPLLSILISFLRLVSEKKKLNHEEGLAEGESKRLSVELINKELTDLYLPLRYYLMQSKMLYDTFALDEKESSVRRGVRFNTLKHLCQGGSFVERDVLILKEIINIGEKQNMIIEEKNWTANGEALGTLLSKYSTHLKILKLAYTHREIREEGIYDEYTFPIELPGAIESQILKLTDRKHELISSERSIGKHSARIERYTVNALNYYNSTISIPPSKDLIDFMSRIKKGGLVCDIGCGSGRDSKYLIQNGFRVFSTEPSAELASLARSYPFIYVKEESLLDMNYPSRFDAIWCSAVLQHIEAINLESAIKKISLMIDSGGVIYLSFRATTTRKERLKSNVTIHDIHKVMALLCKFDLKVIEHKESMSVKDNTNRFYSVLARKKGF